MKAIYFLYNSELIEQFKVMK